MLLFWTFYTEVAGWSTFFQAVPLPPSDTHRHFVSAPASLDPSHHCIIPSLNIREVFLLHDSILDPTTQGVLIFSILVQLKTWYSLLWCRTRNP